MKSAEDFTMQLCFRTSKNSCRRLAREFIWVNVLFRSTLPECFQTFGGAVSGQATPLEYWSHAKLEPLLKFLQQQRDAGTWKPVFARGL